jgi:hypothetical protein
LEKEIWKTVSFCSDGHFMSKVPKHEKSFKKTSWAVEKRKKKDLKLYYFWYLKNSTHLDRRGLLIPSWARSRTLPNKCGFNGMEIRQK